MRRGAERSSRPCTPVPRRDLEPTSCSPTASSFSGRRSEKVRKRGKSSSRVSQAPGVKLLHQEQNRGRFVAEKPPPVLRSQKQVRAKLFFAARAVEVLAD